jgi:CBS domain-containing protein
MRRAKVQDLKVSAFMSADVVTAAPDDTVGDVLGKLKKHDIHEIPILRGKALAGVVTMRDLMRRRAVPPSTKASTLMSSAPALEPDETLPVAAEKMLEAGFRGLPVLRKKALVGLLSRTDLVRAMVEAQALGGLRVGDLMTPSPQCVAEDETVDHAVRMMMSLGERSIPVVDRNRKLRGVVGMKDIADLFARPKVREQYGDRAGREVKVEIDVRSVMRTPAITVGPDSEVQRAAELMVRHNISTVIVAQDEVPVGILTKADLMHVLAGYQEREQLFVELSGLEDEPSHTYDDMYDVIQKEMKRIAQLVTPRTLSIHVQKYKPEGDRWKYSLRARFATAHRIYHMNHFDWDLRIALTDLLDGLYRRIVKEKERKITEKKRHHSS